MSLNDRLFSLIDDHLGLIYVGLVVVVFAAIIMAVRHDNRACRAAYELAQDRRDSLQVLLACNGQRARSTTVMPVPVIIGR